MLHNAICVLSSKRSQMQLIWRIILQRHTLQASVQQLLTSPHATTTNSTCNKINELRHIIRIQFRRASNLLHLWLWSNSWKYDLTLQNMSRWHTSISLSSWKIWLENFFVNHQPAKNKRIRTTTILTLLPSTKYVEKMWKMFTIEKHSWTTKKKDWTKKYHSVENEQNS